MPPAAAAAAMLAALGPLAAGVEPASAAEREPVDVARIETPPTLDGQLDEPLWAGATLVDAFLARYPVEGAAPSARTEVRLAYTARALYVGFRAFAPDPAALRATTVRRDDFAVLENDQFAMAIDSFRDLRNGYWFSTNPLGARVDAQFSDEGQRFQDNWNGVWEAAARVDGSGWTAELEIPWATLRFRAAPEVVMGINLFRRIPETNEQLFAPLIPIVYDSGTPSVSLAPPYRFRGIAGGARFDLRPFALGTSQAERPGARDDDADGGLFVRYLLTESLTLSGTLNADFSEVEVDDAQLNLTRFPLFLPEKRDFFLENAGSFAFGVPGEAELFFSRTIGLAAGAEGETSTVPLDWGIKAAGRAGRLELGILSAETGDAPAAPGERFDVARARLALGGGRSFVGGFWSRRERAGEAPHTTAGADFSHFFPAQVRLQGFAARDRAGRDGARGDADAWFAALARGGERLAFELSVLELDPGFLPAVGLAARPGTRRAFARLDLPWFPPGDAAVRRYVPNALLLRYDDLDGTGYDETALVGFDVDWRSDFRLETGLLRQRERLAAPFAIYRDVVVPAGEYERWEAGIEFASNPARALNYGGEVAAGGLYGGEHLFARFRLTWRPSYLFVVSPSLLADRVVLDQGEFTAWVAQLRFGVTPSAKLRFDLLGQYASERRAAGAGLRARYDFREGTQLVAAWDSIEERDPLRTPRAPARVERERAAAKLTYLVRF
jgi:hypothetical protein